MAGVGTGINQVAVAVGIAPGTVFVTPGGTTTHFIGAASAFATLTNSGIMAVTADATATGFNALAVAGVGTGIDQNAIAIGAQGANAGALLVNNGLLEVSGFASANASNSALAFAGVGNGIEQDALAIAVFGGVASANAALSNNSVIDIHAAAVAGGLGTATPALFATANAGVGTGIEQDATAVGPVAVASASLTNSGAIGVGADALATAQVTATANATVGTGITQSANAIGTVSASAVASLGNSGNIDITAECGGACAGDYGSRFGHRDPVPVRIRLRVGCNRNHQDAFASALTATVTTVAIGGTIIATFTYGGAANAAAVLTNTGSINIAATPWRSPIARLRQASSALASSRMRSQSAARPPRRRSTSDQQPERERSTSPPARVAVGTQVASASASVETGISQNATASVFDGTAIANVLLVNDGAITIAARLTPTPMACSSSERRLRAPPRPPPSSGPGSSRMLSQTGLALRRSFTPRSATCSCSSPATLSRVRNWSTPDPSRSLVMRPPTAVPQSRSPGLALASIRTSRLLQHRAPTRSRCWSMTAAITVAGNALATGTSFAYAGAFIGSGIQQRAVR